MGNNFFSKKKIKYLKKVQKLYIVENADWAISKKIILQTI